MNYSKKTSWVALVAMCLTACAGGEDEPMTSPPDGATTMDSGDVDATTPPIDAAPPEPDAAPPPPPDSPPRWDEMARAWFEDTPAEGLTLRWSGATDDNGITGYRVERDGLMIAEVGGEETMAAFETAPDHEEHVFRVVAGDAAGQWTPGPSATYRLDDSTPPTWTEGAALVATDLSARGVTLAWTAAEDDVGVIHYLLADDDAEPSVVENTRYRADDADPRQERSFTVWAVDAAGNQSQPLSLTLTIPGGTAPTWPEGSTVQALAPGADWIDLQWTAAQDDEAVTQYTLYNGLVPVTTVAGDQLRGRISGLSPYATYQLSVSAEDADGNRTAGPETSARTADAVTPSWPEDARIVASDITPSSLTLGWTPADDDVDVAGYVISRAGSPDLPAAGQSVRVEGLSPWTDYQFTVNAVDPAGNTSADGPSLALRTPDGVAPTWPRNPLRAAALGTDAVRLDWDPAADDVAVTGYRVSRAGAEDVVLDGATHTLQVQGLPPWTTYTFSIEAMDAAGNVSATTPVARARTLDQGVPTWADGEALQITDLTPNELVLRWPAPQDDVAVTVVMVYRDGALLAALPGGATSHAVEGLDPWTHIDFEIRAGDAAGNWTRAPLTARTQTPDWVRPDWGPNPTLMFQNVTPDSVLLRWPAAVDDVGLVYHVHQDGALLDTLPEGTTELAVVNLTPWGTYAFTVEAVDAAGNLAQPSLSGRIRTADDAPPTWPADAALTAGNATPRSLTLTWSDAADDVGLTYVIHRDGVLFGTFPEGTTSVDVDRLTPATDYSFSIYVVDPAGNRAATLRLNTQTPDNISPWWPADPALSVTDLTSTSLTLQWPQAQDDVSLTYLVRHDGVEVATLPPETLSMAFQGLSTWGEYPFDVVAIDTFGNRSPVLALTVRTPDQVVPSWAPDAQLDVSDLTEQSLTLDWPAAVDDIRVSYLVYRDGNLLAALPPEMTTLAVADLTPWTDYQFRVAAVDPAGNISAPALTAAVQTPDAASPDWGPQATLTAENVAPDSLTLRWSPATDNVGLVYRVRQDDAIIDTVPEGTVELAVADLSPWQNYAFAVEAVDPAGNIGPNGPSLALQTPDERAPQWGPDSDLTAPALDHQSVTLQWPPAVDDAAVTGYRLSINGAALPALPGDQNSVDINQLTEATDYAFEIIAFDAAGNESANPLTLALQTPRTPCPEPLAVQASNTSAAPFGFVRFTITGGTGAYQMDFLAPRSGGNLLANPFSYLAGPTGDVVDTIRFSDAGCMDVVDVDIQVYDQAQLNPQRVTLPLGGCVALDVTGGSGEFDFSVVSNQPVGQIDAQGVYTSDDEVGRDILRVVDRRTGESLESIVTISQDARFDLGGQNLFLPLGGHLDPSFAVGTGQFTLASEDDVITISEDGRRLIANRVGTTRVTATDPTVGCLVPNADQPTSRG